MTPPIKNKIELFKKEIGNQTLTHEQQRVYNAFVYQRSKAYTFAVRDKYGSDIHFTLPTNNTKEGAMHILLKHYKGVGAVSAMEILNLCDIVRKGEISVKNKHLIYTYKKEGNTYKLIVALKQTSTEKNILKSFYSNKK